ncbi:MAG: sensor histidine kinase [Ginsengibacter sp.]
MTKDEQIKELTDVNEDLENYFRNTIIPQLFFDGNFILRKYTPPAMKQFNLSPADIGKSVHDIINNLRFPSIVENIKYVINTRDILEKEIQTTDLRWFQMNILPYVQRKDSKANGVIVTFVDITSRIKDLKEQEKLIADYETLLDTLAHDIKNPLGNLMITIDLLNEGSAENAKEFKTLLNILEKDVKKIHKLVDELTESRQQEHMYKSKDELLNFENIVEDVNLALLDYIKKTEATITTDLEVAEITFSRRKLRSIAFNLLNNAIKFRSPDRKPEIFIKTSREGDFIILSIKDNGIGIDPAHLEKIFSKYYRISQDVEGTGVGLYLVKQLVTNVGGKIVVDSQTCKGTEFKVYLKTA